MRKLVQPGTDDVFDGVINHLLSAISCLLVECHIVRVPVDFVLNRCACVTRKGLVGL